MINLLGEGSQKDLKAARMNVVLATYCGIVGLALVCVLLLVLFSHWWLGNQLAAAHQRDEINQSRTTEYDSVKAQGEQFSANLNKVQTVLSQRTQYSTALLNIASTLPAGTYINEVSFSPTFVTTPLKIIANTQTNAQAVDLPNTLTKSKMYTSVKLDNVNCGGVNGNGCAASLTVTLNPATIFSSGVAQ